MSLGDIMEIASSGLMAQRTRITVTASNLANAETTRTPEGGAYRRRDPVFVSQSVGGPFADRLHREMRGVRVDRIQEDDRDFIVRFQPGHPDANKDGNVEYPRVNTVEEMTNLMSASRSFDANLMIFHKVKAMSEAILKLGA